MKMDMIEYEANCPKKVMVVTLKTCERISLLSLVTGFNVVCKMCISKNVCNYHSRPPYGLANAANISKIPHHKVWVFLHSTNGKRQYHTQ